MRVVAYLRVSSIEQVEHGYGLDSQRAAIAAAAKVLGARVVAWTSDEGISGTLKAEDRPGLAEALDLVRSGKADALIVRDLDRLARAVTVQEAVLAEVWCNGNASVYTSVPAQEVPRDDPDDPYRTAMRQMAGVFVELERRLIVKRLRDGRRTKASQGGHATGGVPYGWRSEKKTPTNPSGALVPVPAEQAALTLMRTLADAGSSTRDIAAQLIAAGHPTKRGGTWSSATVSRILARADRLTKATA